MFDYDRRTRWSATPKHQGFLDILLSWYIRKMEGRAAGPTFLALAALADGRKHGYGIIQEVERLSDGRTRLRAGTLYAMLDRLTHDGMIASAGEEVVDGRLRHYYELTETGTSAVAAESVTGSACQRKRCADFAWLGGWHEPR